MPVWKSFVIDKQIYDLSHLDYQEFTAKREQTETHPLQEVKFFMSFSDHCFTDHYGENDNWIYRHATSPKDRYFCLNRYHHSKGLPSIIPQMINENPYIGRYYNQTKEQFFHVDQKFHDVTYRIFFDISKNNSPRATTDLRIKILSAYEPRTTQELKPIPSSGYFKMWKIIDSRLDGIPLKKGR